jgi:hypothetical protein
MPRSWMLRRLSWRFRFPGKNNYTGTTADPSTALRSGRDDKGRAVTFRKVSNLDGQGYKRLLCEDRRSLHCASLRSG